MASSSGGSVHNPSRVIDALIVGAGTMSPEQKAALVGKAQTLLSILGGDTHFTTSVKACRDWTWPVNEMAPEILALICFHLSDITVFCGLPLSSKSLQASMRSTAFLGALTRLQHDVPWASLLHDCAIRPNISKAPDYVSPYLEATPFDFSRGEEPYFVSISTSLTIPSGANGELIHLYSDMPCLADFSYEAGPWPAAFPLQVYRAGMIGSLGFGVRPLVPIKKGSFVCTYWGQYMEHEPDRLARVGGRRTGARKSSGQAYWSGPASHHDTPYTLFGDAGVQPQILQAEKEDESMGAEDCPCALCGRDKEYESEDEGGSCFRIEAAFRGNIARWINHSSTAPNLVARLSNDAAVPLESGSKVSFYAARDIGIGEQLLWDYMFGDEAGFGAARKSMPPGFLPDGAAEMLRMAADNTPVRTEWFAKDGDPCAVFGATDTVDTLLVQGYPGSGEPYASQGAHEEMFPSSHPLPSEPWDHDPVADAPEVVGDVERCAHWNMPRWRTSVSADAARAMKVAELKEALKERGLDTSGKRAELLERLLANL